MRGMSSSCCKGGSVEENETKKTEDLSASEQTTCCRSTKSESSSFHPNEPPSKKNETCCSVPSIEIAGTMLQDETDTVSAHGEEGCCSTTLQKSETSCCASTTTRESDSSVERLTSSYRVEGMDCPSCAATLEKGLLAIPLYQSVSVNYGAARLKIESEAVLDDRQLENDVKKLGFQLVVPVKEGKVTETYTVSGMDCSSCAKTIEQHFQNIESVQRVSVSFPRGEMDIAHQLDVQTVQQELKKSALTDTSKDRHPPSLRNAHTKG